MEPDHDPFAPFPTTLALDPHDVALVRRYAACSMLLVAVVVIASVIRCPRCMTSRQLSMADHVLVSGGSGS